jgi:ubiquinone/menaquinone biosynthesis C-methylase UbiE
MTLYDVIGKTYSSTRRSDSRIAEKLLEILASSQASTIADIGAGTGSYALVLAERGYRVFAIEPSAMMRSHAIAHPAIKWISGYADNLPLPNQSVDAVIIMLAFHHFQDYRQALREVHRVVGNGQIVLFTYDPTMISSFWLTKYFPSFIKDVESTFLPIPQLIDEIQTVVGHVVNVVPFPLPHDLSDSFAAVGWARPELYFDSSIRNGISSFAKISTDELDNGLSQLREDLETGIWDQEYGHLRQQKQYDVGYRFVHSSVV